MHGSHVSFFFSPPLFRRRRGGYTLLNRKKGEDFHSQFIGDDDGRGKVFISKKKSLEKLTIIREEIACGVQPNIVYIDGFLLCWIRRRGRWTSDWQATRMLPTMLKSHGDEEERGIAVFVKHFRSGERVVTLARWY